MSEFLICLGAATLGFMALGALGLIIQFIEHLYKRFTGQYTETSVKLRLLEEANSDWKIKQKIETKINLSKYNVHDMDKYVDDNDNQVLRYFTEIMGRYERDIERNKAAIDNNRQFIDTVKISGDKANTPYVLQLQESLLENVKDTKEMIEQNRLSLNIFDKQFKKDEPPYFGSSDLKKWFKKEITDYESVPLPTEVSAVKLSKQNSPVFDRRMMR